MRTAGKLLLPVLFLSVVTHAHLSSPIQILVGRGLLDDAVENERFSRRSQDQFGDDLWWSRDLVGEHQSLGSRKLREKDDDDDDDDVDVHHQPGWITRRAVGDQCRRCSPGRIGLDGSLLCNHCMQEYREMFPESAEAFTALLPPSPAPPPPIPPPTTATTTTDSALSLAVPQMHGEVAPWTVKSKTPTGPAAPFLAQLKKLKKGAKEGSPEPGFKKPPAECERWGCTNEPTVVQGCVTGRLCADHRKQRAPRKSRQVRTKCANRYKDLGGCPNHRTTDNVLCGPCQVLAEQEKARARLAAQQ